MRGEIAKRANQLASLPQRMGNADPTSGDIHISWDLIEHRSVLLSREVKAQWKGPPRQARRCRMDIPNVNHGPFSSTTNCRIWSATYHATYFRPFAFSYTPFPPISTSFIKVESIPPIFPLYLILSPYFKTKLLLPGGRSVLPALLLRTRRRSLPRFLNFWIIVPIAYIIQSKRNCNSECDIFMTVKIKL